MTLAHSRRLAITLLIAAALLASSCGPGDRPSVAEWRPSWDQALEIIPPESELDAPPSEAECQEVLGALRDVRPELSPAPDDIIDATVGAWFTYAESTFFTCFRSVPSEDRVARAYDTLDRLREEVETAISTAGAGDG
ncbi:MAG: hypothetical protein R3343_11685 [Nitriliruptorales bacterium]|nr:hypothetical protein [Nitriliruptorales bacterium]